MTRKSLRIAAYNTKRGAQRYANDLLYHCVGVVIDTHVVPTAGFKYGVMCHLANGKSAMAARRPHSWGWTLVPPTVNNTPE